MVAVRVPLHLGLMEAEELFQCCEPLLQSLSPPRQILLDFHETVFLDSSGVGALLALYREAQAVQVPLVALDVHPQLQTVFTLTQLDQLLQMDCTSPRSNRDRIFAFPLPPTHPSINDPRKRALDIIGALVGLGITALIFLPIALLIHWDSPGPILFSQIRLGWLGRPFRIWKFRSMVANAETLKPSVKNQVKGAFFKNAVDPRITRIGKFLRRSSLDEFPQFWNVLMGEMSLVGTRPPTPDEVEKYQLRDWQRLNVRPGLTGEWQVNCRSNITCFEEVVQLDLLYQDNWSLLYDIKLICKTLITLFRKTNGAV